MDIGRIYGKPIAKVARDFGVHVATLFRWNNKGFMNNDGNRVTLEVSKYGGRTYVRREDVIRFIEVRNGRCNPDEPPEVLLSRQEEIAAVKIECDRFFGPLD